jgi:hypothetical protein
MCDIISQVDSHLSHDSPDVCVLSTVSVLSCTLADSTETTSQTTDSIPKTIRDKSYVNMQTYESNWSGSCILCNKIQNDSKGVTSNFNRHVKTH